MGWLRGGANGRSPLGWGIAEYLNQAGCAVMRMGGIAMGGSMRNSRHLHAQKYPCYEKDVPSPDVMPLVGHSNFPATLCYNITLRAQGTFDLCHT